jgi:hypothetical protein
MTSIMVGVTVGRSFRRLGFAGACHRIDIVFFNEPRLGREMNAPKTPSVLDRLTDVPGTDLY